MNPRIELLRTAVRRLYEESSEPLLFHGWHHIQFVAKKAAIFAGAIGADVGVSVAAALTHDLNYLVERNSEPEMGARLRAETLAGIGYSADEIECIEAVVAEAHTANRGVVISKEGVALSDADTLFKALPITPILFAGNYIRQNDVDIKRLADKVVAEQVPLLEQGIYFYTDLAKESYMEWAKVNVAMWSNVRAAMKDPDVLEVISTAQANGAL